MHVVEERDFGREAQQAAEKHLAACQEALFEFEENPPEDGESVAVESPASGPFCGCDTCVVREVLYAAWPIMLESTKVAEQA